MITIIIPTLCMSNEIVLRTTLKELISCSVVENIKIYDNTDEGVFTTKFSDTLDDKIEIVSKEENLYVNPAWNDGVSNTKTKYYMLLNDDLILKKEVIELCYRKMEEDSKLGAICVEVNERDLEESAEKLIEEYRFIEPESFEYLESFSGPMVIGRKDTWVEIPRELRYYFGDNFIAFYLNRNGYKFGKLSPTYITHFSGSTTQKILNDIPNSEYNFYSKYIWENFLSIRGRANNV